MKHTFFVFLAAAACAASALAQTSPAPSGSASLTKEERESAVSYLKNTEKDFLTAIGGVSDAQWKFKAAPDRWSIAETAEHIATAEDFIWARVNEMMKAPANPERRVETAGKDKIILDKTRAPAHRSARYRRDRHSADGIDTLVLGCTRTIRAQGGTSEL